MSLPQEIRELWEYSSVLGHKVTRPTQVIGNINAGRPIFTISGGFCYVTLLYGLVTTATTAVATTMGLTINPTVGANVALDSAAAVVNNIPAGNCFWLPDLVTNPMLGSPALAGVATMTPAVRAAFIAPAGTIDWIIGGANNPDGLIQWVLFYIPLVTGARIVIF